MSEIAQFCDYYTEVKPEFCVDEISDRVYNFWSREGFLELRSNSSAFERWLGSLNGRDFREEIDQLNLAVSDQLILKSISDELFDDDCKVDLLASGLEALKQLDCPECRASLLYYLMMELDLYRLDNQATALVMGYLLLDQPNLAGLRQLLRPEKMQFEALRFHQMRDYLNRDLASRYLDADFFKIARDIQLSDVDPTQFLPKNTVDELGEDFDLLKKCFDASEGYFSLPKLLVEKTLEKKAIDNPALLEALSPADYCPPLDSFDQTKIAVLITVEPLFNQLSSVDCRQLLLEYANLKQLQIETLIDVFLNPDAHQLGEFDAAALDAKSAYCQAIAY